MPDLASMDAVGQLAIAACAVRSLRELSVEVNAWPKGLTIAAPLERLRVWARRGGFTIDRIEAPERLEYLHIEGGGTFDAASLLALPKLRSLVLARLTRVEHLDRLLEHPNLNWISMARVRSAPGGEALEAFRGHLIIEGNRIFTPEAMARIKAARRQWYITPYRPPA